MVRPSVLYLAAVLSLASCIAHIVIGTAKSAAPVLETLSPEDGTRATMTFSWETNSILMIFIAVGFVAGAISRRRELPVFVTVMTLFLAVWGTFVSLRLSFNPLQFPPAILFFIIGLVGLIGSTGVKIDRNAASEFDFDTHRQGD